MLFYYRLTGDGLEPENGTQNTPVISEARRVRGRLAANINEKIRVFIVIQAFNQQKRERRRFRKQSQQLKTAMMERARASAGMRVINEGATALSMATILSLGQRHKLTIARALLGQPVILIVDEIDANLDKQAAEVLENVLKNFCGTVLLVSRSAQRLALADSHWHLKAGQLQIIKVSGAQKQSA